MKKPSSFLRLLALTCFIWPGLLRAAEPTLDIYWIDVEGGGGTLIVTPAQESILIDTGWADSSSAARIHSVAANAGISRIDYLILTHFHSDHFGGAAPLAALMPIGTVLDNGIPDHDPDGGNDEKFRAAIKPYTEFRAERRVLVQPGMKLPLKDGSQEFRSSSAMVLNKDGSITPLKVPQSTTRVGGNSLSFTFMGARKHFFHPPGMGGPNALCAGGTQMAPDTSDNANSVVSLLQLGPFKFYDGGDLTWNMEGEMVCPVNSIGQVDVFQVDHHGMDISNNPLLISSLAPTVSVMNNGSRKGGAKATLANLRSVSSIQTMYQLHRDLRGGADFNTDDQFIANSEEKCEGNYIKCSVESSGKSYTISIPAKGFSKTYQTRAPEAGR